METINKKTLSERDICTKYITPAIVQAGWNLFNQIQEGISREGLSMKNLQDLIIPIPPLEEQRRIVARVDQLISLCDKLEAGLMRSQADRERGWWRRLWEDAGGNGKRI